MGDGIKLDVRPPEASGDETLVSAIIPLSIREAEPGALLATLPRTFEIILARGGTRASSMNAAALAARGRHLWFVHADTALTPDAVEALLAQLNRESDALRYFDLRFDGGALMRLTELGVWFRSRALGIPFGDQALCLPAHWFKALGGYAEAAGPMAKITSSSGRRAARGCPCIRLERPFSQAPASIARTAGSERP